MFNETYMVSFFCYYADSETPSKKVQELALYDIPRWIECYQFTHPNCQAISTKIWFKDRK